MVEDSDSSNQKVENSDSNKQEDEKAPNPNMSNLFWDKIQHTIRTLPSTWDRDLFKTKIKGAVDSTNQLLGNLEEKYITTNVWIDTNIRPIMVQGQEMTHKAKELYEQRRVYGPHIIGVTVATSGLITAIKTRGRMVPSLLVSGFVGGMVYSGIYGLPPLFDNVVNYRIHRRKDE